MVITITASQMDAKKLEAVEAFLSDFLPRMKREPGIVEMVHYVQNDLGNGHDARHLGKRGPRPEVPRGALIKEAIAFEQSQQLSSTRDGPFAVTRFA